MKRELALLSGFTVFTAVAVLVSGAAIRGQLSNNDFVLDNGDMDTETARYIEYSTQKPWSTHETGYKGTQRYSHKLYSPNGRAMWRFFKMAPGTYEVYATWAPVKGLAEDAPYFVFDGSTMIGTIKKDQRNAPATIKEDGADWELIGTFAIKETNMSIILSNTASSFVAADAIRVRPVVAEGASSSQLAVAVCGNKILEGGEQCDDGNSVSKDGCTEVCTIETKDLSVRDIELSDDFNQATITLAEVPGVPLSLHYTIYQQDVTGMVGEGRGIQDKQSGTMSGLLVHFAKNGTAQYRLVVTVCAAETCSPEFIKHVSFKAPSCSKDSDCGTTACTIKEDLCSFDCSLNLCITGVCHAKTVPITCSLSGSGSSAASHSSSSVSVSSSAASSSAMTSSSARSSSLQ